MILIQSLGIVSALPTLLLLLIALLRPLAGYRLGDLKFRMLSLYLVDTANVLENAVLRPAETHRLLEACADVDRRFETEENPTFDEAEFSRSMERLFGSRTVSDRILAGINEGRLRLNEELLDHYLKTLRRFSPVRASYLRDSLIRFEQLRVVSYSARNEGNVLARAILESAGRRVTDGSVLGLILSIVYWIAAVWSKTDFLTVIGQGVTIGAFLGLVATSAAFGLKILPPSTFSGLSTKHRLYLAAFFCVSLLLFAMERSGWLPVYWFR